MAGACRTRSPAWECVKSSSARSTEKGSCVGWRPRASPCSIAPRGHRRRLDAAPCAARRAWTRAGPRARARVVAGAPPPSKTIERVETELGWEFIQIYGLTETAPLLTFNRAPAEWDGLDAAERSTPALPARASLRWACACAWTRRASCSRASNHVFEGYWNQPRRRPRRSPTLVPHRRRGRSRRGLHRHHRPQERRDHQRRRECSSIEVEDCLSSIPRWPRSR